jgi:N-acetylmuramoyl-L-alanine amidase
MSSRLLIKAACAMCAVVAFGQTTGGKRLSVYTAQTGYSIPVVDAKGSEYVGILDLLQPMGTASGRVDKRKYRLTFGSGDESVFEDGKTRARLRKKEVDLPAEFLLANGRGLVSLRSAPMIVSALTGATVDLHEGSRRMFVGAQPIRYSAQLQKDGNSRLVLTFSAPVNPTVATEHGKVQLTFTRDPLVSNGNDRVVLGDPLFPAVSFAENNGAAELTINVGAPMIANFSNANRTISLAPVAPQTANEVAAAQQPTPGQTPPAPTTVAPGPTVQRSAFFVLIDPSHGGSDRGAALTDKLAEKDAVLTIARRLRGELEAKGVPARLLRDSDTDLPSDRRAVAINTSQPGCVLFVHAGTVGNGVHVATAALPTARSGPVRWGLAQSFNLDAGRELANAIASEVLKRDVPVVRLNSSVPPLNETAAPAVVLEVTPPVNGSAVDVISNDYISSIAAGVAAATSSKRRRLEGR